MIPIYRAFSETFDKYILGVPYFSDGRYYMLVDDCNKNNNIGSGSYPIDETTLAIHFPNILDSQGNKIFASLSEDGKGGDIVTLDDRNKTIIYDKKVQAIMLNCKNFGLSILSLYKEDIKAIGIQK